jgi:hypothetical protein
MRNSAKDKAVSIEVSQKIAIPRVVNFIFSGFLLAGVVIDILVDVLFRRGNQTEAYEITNALYYPVTDAMNWIALAAMIIIIIAIILKRVDTRLALGITLVLTMMLFVVDLTMSTSRVTVFDDKVLITTFMSLSLTMSAGFLVGTALALPMGAVATAAIVGFGLYAGGEHLVTQQIPILLFVFSLMSVILVLYRQQVARDIRTTNESRRKIEEDEKRMEKLYQQLSTQVGASGGEVSATVSRRP